MFSSQKVPEIYLVKGLYKKSLLKLFLLSKANVFFLVAFLFFSGYEGAYLTPGSLALFK
jgi:hypothetical protein